MHVEDKDFWGKSQDPMTDPWDEITSSTEMLLGDVGDDKNLNISWFHEGARITRLESSSEKSLSLGPGAEKNYHLDVPAS